MSCMGIHMNRVITRCSRRSYFTRSGSAEDYYAPGTYIKISMSKTITLGVEVVEEPSVPQTALEKIQELGTKAD